MSLLTDTTNYTYMTGDVCCFCEDYQEGPIVWMCIGVATFVFGFPGALAVLWDLLQKGRKRIQITPYDIFLINVTIIDVLFLQANLLEVFNYKFWHILGIEESLTFLYSLNMCGRPLFSTFVCVDCYLAVVHPVVYRANKSLTPRVLIVIALWSVTFIFGYLCLSQRYLPSRMYMVLIIILTLPICTFCDTAILWTLKSSNPAGGSIHPMKKKVLRVIINNAVVTFTSYLPPVIGTLVSECLNLNGELYYCLVLTPVLCSMTVGNAVSPILHLSNLGKLDWLKTLCKKLTSYIL